MLLLLYSHVCTRLCGCYISDASSSLITASCKRRSIVCYLSIRLLMFTLSLTSLKYLQLHVLFINAKVFYLFIQNKNVFCASFFLHISSHFSFSIFRKLWYILCLIRSSIRWMFVALRVNLEKLCVRNMKLIEAFSDVT